MLQVTDTERFGRRRQLPRWISDRLSEVTEAYLGSTVAHESRLLADPLVALERLAESKPAIARPWPAFFASVGTRDPLLDDTRRLEQALSRLGVTQKTRYYPGELHAFQALVYREQARRCWQETYEFLDRHLRT
jgi:acetyl esterase